MADNSQNLKVLVVDDEPNIVELLTVSLKFQGFEVETANSGPAAIELAHSWKPDAYILDVMMPEMDGFELLSKLRAEGLDAPVLFLTAKDAVEDRIHGLTIGADDYVTKPFSLEEVITRLRVILRRGNVSEDANEDTTLRYADLTLNDDTHEVTKAGEIVELLPTTPPVVFAASMRSGLRPRLFAAVTCRLANRALAEVSEPVTATPTQPRTGEKKANAGPRLAKNSPMVTVWPE